MSNPQDLWIILFDIGGRDIISVWDSSNGPARASHSHFKSNQSWSFPESLYHKKGWSSNLDVGARFCWSICSIIKRKDAKGWISTGLTSEEIPKGPAWEDIILSTCSDRTHCGQCRQRGQAITPGVWMSDNQISMNTSVDISGLP